MHRPLPQPPTPATLEDILDRIATETLRAHRTGGDTYRYLGLYDQLVEFAKEHGYHIPERHRD